MIAAARDASAPRRGRVAGPQRAAGSVSSEAIVPGLPSVPPFSSHKTTMKYQWAMYSAQRSDMSHFCTTCPWGGGVATGNPVLVSAGTSGGRRSVRRTMANDTSNDANADTHGPSVTIRSPAADIRSGGTPGRNLSPWSASSMYVCTKLLIFDKIGFLMSYKSDRNLYAMLIQRYAECG
jgi:hypothetical protein